MGSFLRGAQRWARRVPGGRRALTFGALDAGVLVVAEEEALPAEALVAAHHVDAGLLAAAVALGALVQVCKGKAVGRGG